MMFPSLPIQNDNSQILIMCFWNRKSPEQKLTNIQRPNSYHISTDTKNKQTKTYI